MGDCLLLTSPIRALKEEFPRFRGMVVKRSDPQPLKAKFHPKEAARIQKRLKGRPYVVIHPASVTATKRWDPGLFAQVARRLTKRRPLATAVTAGPGEESFASQ